MYVSLIQAEDRKWRRRKILIDLLCWTWGQWGSYWVVRARSTVRYSISYNHGTGQWALLYWWYTIRYWWETYSTMKINTFEFHCFTLSYILTNNLMSNWMRCVIFLYHLKFNKKKMVIISNHWGIRAFQQIFRMS